MAFGISPNTLALRPSTLIQDRAGRESRAQQASQYQRSRQDSRDKFAQTMASQEASRKADFAKTQFMAEHNMELQRAKTKAGLLEDIAKEDKRQQENILKQTQAIDKDINSKAWKAALDNGDASTYSQYQDLIRKTLYPETVQQAPQFQPEQQPQPQVQPAGAGNEEAELRAEMERIQQGGQPVQQEWKGIPYPMPEQAEEVAQQPQQPQHEYTDAYKAMNPYIISSIKQAEEPVDVTPAPVIPQAKAIPRDVAGTDYEDKYTLLQEELKNAPEVSRKSFTKTGVFGKAKKFDQKGYSAAIKASNSAKTKIKKEMADIVFDAKKINKLTPAQQINFAQEILSYGTESVPGHPYTVRQIKWANDLISKYTGGAGTEQSGTQEKQLAENPNTGQKIYSVDGGKTWYDNSTGERI